VKLYLDRRSLCSRNQASDHGLRGCNGYPDLNRSFLTSPVSAIPLAGLSFSGIKPQIAALTGASARSPLAAQALSEPHDVQLLLAHVHPSALELYRELALSPIGDGRHRLPYKQAACRDIAFAASSTRSRSYSSSWQTGQWQV
jgi:hypothetical protein